MYRVNPGDNQDEDRIGQDVFVAQAPNVSTGGGTLAPPATHTGGADQERVASEAGSQDAEADDVGRPSRPHAVETFLPADGDVNVDEVPARYVEPPLRGQPPQYLNVKHV